MDFSFFQPNPKNRNTGDCVVRAICKATAREWHDVYTALCVQGYSLCDWGDSNAVWSAYLLENGFHRQMIPDTCPYCYTITDFGRDHPNGVFIVATGKHVACAIDGVLYDSWDSRNEIVSYYFYKNNA
ncbi:MAG: hypothetical protein IJH64_00605 [Oscillospiraceae bacterium]|nr:hypothetical protein [Oscillospiraceae bacterium]